jgi:hypothetical protein
MPRNIQSNRLTKDTSYRAMLFANRHRTAYNYKFYIALTSAPNSTINLGVMKGKRSSQYGRVLYAQKGAFHPRVANTITMSGSQVADRAYKRRRVSKPPLHSECN